MATVINVSSEDVKEAKNAAGGFDPIPSGKYNVSIYDVSVEEYKSVKNKGKPYYNLQLRVTEGDFAKRVLFAQVPHFTNWAVSPDPDKAAKWPNGFPTNLLSFLEVVDIELEGSVELPDEAYLTGKELTVQVRVEDDDYRNEKDGTTDQKRNSIQRFLPLFDEDPSPSREAAAASAKPKVKAKVEGGFDV